ncbi:MAG: HAD family hydrolase [Planctomycetota bacterium]|jgi:hydroxymethylpyrimidine pyrophosphatase-like HAD family hydrolase
MDSAQQHTRPAPRALALDLDGTLVADDGQVPPRVVEVLRARISAGIPVCIATGRSELGARPVLDQLGAVDPAVVYNGAALWCPRAEGFLEERVLADRSVAAALEFGRDEGLMALVGTRGARFASHSEDPLLQRAVDGIEGVNLLPYAELPVEYLIRVTLFCPRSATSGDLRARFESRVQAPLYLTDFAIDLLAQHRGSPVKALDVQPPCRGKAEILRWLREERGIRPSEVVAVGDATNDLPMLAEAGLGVAMGNAAPEVQAAADRVIGDCNGEALADLVEELFPL